MTDTEIVEAESVSKDADKYDWRTNIDLGMPAEEVWRHQDSDQNTNEQSKLTENSEENSEQYPPREQIEYLEAQNYLWPDQRTQESLNHLIKIKYQQSDDRSHSHPHYGV